MHFSNSAYRSFFSSAILLLTFSLSETILTLLWIIDIFFRVCSRVSLSFTSRAFDASLYVLVNYCYILETIERANYGRSRFEKDRILANNS